MRAPQPNTARLGTSLLIWAYTAALACATTLTWLFDGRSLHSISSPVHVLWPLLACGFALGHFANINVEFRGSSHGLDLTDVMIVPAIIVTGVLPAIAAAAIGTLIRSIYIRRPPIKAAFNVTVHAFAMSLAILTFHAVLGSATVLSPRGWLAAATAVLVAAVVTGACIHVVIGIATHRFVGDGLTQVVIMLPIVFAIDFILGLAAVEMLWASLGGGILFIGVAIAVAFAYAAHGRLQMRHRTLNQLYHFEQALAGIVESDQVIVAVLNEALVLFNAEVAQLVLPGEQSSECHTLRAGESQPIISYGPHPLVEVLEPGSNVLVAPRSSPNQSVAAALSECGFRDAITLRLPTDVAGTLEVLVVADRLGSYHATFDAADGHLAEALATPAAMALRSSDLLNQLRSEVAIKEHQANHDALTGLANRTLFAESVDAALDNRRPNTSVGVMIIDLDGFKSLNDSFGHEAGDSMLLHLSECLSRLIGERGLVARLGGDEFAVVVPHEREPEEIAALAQALDRAIGAPVTISGATVHVRASIGVAIAPVHGEDRKTLLRHADFAMYRAKQRGGGVARHNDNQNGRLDRPSMIAALREAIHTSSLTLNYQPKLRLATMEIVGVESLLRWTHPIYGAISPDQVIPVAESAGLIGPLTRWVLEAAISQCSAWHRDGLDLNVAVNLSPSQIDDPDILEQVLELLETYGLPANALTLEITESADIPGKACDDVEMLETLSRLGVRLSIDDFGVGTSSLTRVRHFPVKELKIDKSFVMSLNIEPKDLAVVASTVELAHHLGLEVVAEGVETEAIAEQLSTLGCDIVQGYLYSPPLVADALAYWVRERARSVPVVDSEIIPIRPLATVSGRRLGTGTR
jgi:diguanylate cyclase (GGDEF)-like protein